MPIKQLFALASPTFRAGVSGLEGELQCEIAYTRNGAFCVPLASKHRPPAQRVFEGSLHEPDTLAFMVQNCGRGDVVHAGAYFGDFLPILSRALAPGSKVWAFEPSRENFRCATVTVLLNDLQNVELANQGLGATEHRASLLNRTETGLALGSGSKVVHAPEEIDRSLIEEVSIVALDEVLPGDREVSILQLDVERYERMALEGATATIKRCRPTLILETIEQGDWLDERILELGYRKSGKLHLNTVFVPEN